MSEDTVELGVQFLECFEHDELSLPEVIDRLEALTTQPTQIRRILETAEDRGVIERDGKQIRPARSRGGVVMRFEPQVTVKEGDFTCKRCGAGLSTGHFLNVPAGEHGPFGSTCIRKVTGKE